MIFARRVFLVAGIFGLLAVLPVYFMEGQISRDQPPAITHPEFFYGFVGLAVPWQVAFLIISRDPSRFRPLMVPSVLEKVIFGISLIALYAAGRILGQVLAVGLIDLTFGILFVVAYLRTAKNTGAAR